MSVVGLEAYIAVAESPPMILADISRWATSCSLLPAESLKRTELVAWAEKTVLEKQKEKVLRVNWENYAIPTLTATKEKVNFESLLAMILRASQNPCIKNVTLNAYELWKAEPKEFLEFAERLAKVADHLGILLWDADDLDSVAKSWDVVQQKKFIKLVRIALQHKLMMNKPYKPFPFQVSFEILKQFLQECFNTNLRANQGFSILEWAVGGFLFPEDEQKRKELVLWAKEQAFEKDIKNFTALIGDGKKPIRTQLHLDIRGLILDDIRIGKILDIDHSRSLKLQANIVKISLIVDLSKGNTDIEQLEKLIVKLRYSELWLNIEFKPIEQITLAVLQNTLQLLPKYQKLSELDLSTNQLWKLDKKTFSEFITKAQNEVHEKQKLVLWSVNDGYLRLEAPQWAESKKQDYIERLFDLLPLQKECPSNLFPFFVKPIDQVKFCMELLKRHPECSWIGMIQVYLGEQINLLKPDELILVQDCQQWVKLDSLYKNASPSSILFNTFVKNDRLDELQHFLTQDFQSPIQLSVNIADLNDTELEKLAHFLNDCSLPSTCKELNINSTKPTEKGEGEKLVNFLQQIKTQGLRILKLDGPFDKLPFAQLKTVVQSILAMDWIQGLNFTSRTFDVYSEKELSEIIELLKQHSKLTEFALEGYHLFENRSLKFIIESVNQCLQMPRVTHFSFFTPKLISSNLLSGQDLEDYLNLLLAVIPKHKHGIVQSPFSGLVSIEKECEYLVQLIAEHPNLIATIKSWIKNREQFEPFTYEQRLKLAKTCVIASTDDTPSYDDFDLKPEDLLELYILSGPMTGHDTLYSFDSDDFNLLDSELPETPFIKAMGIITFGNPEDESQAEKEEAETMSPLQTYLLEPEKFSLDIQQKVLPVLRQACNERWPKQTFYEPCLQYLENRGQNVKQEDIHEVVRWYLLVSWYVWVMSYVSSHKIENLDKLEKPLKEIARYPDEKMRYFLIDALIKIWHTKRGQEIYAELTDPKQKSEDPARKRKKLKTNIMYTPEIFLSAIAIQTDLSEVFDTKEVKELAESERKEGLEEDSEQLSPIDSCKRIMTALTKPYQQAHYFKSFVGALQTLSMAPGLTAVQKLRLIQKLLQDKKTLTETSKLKEFFKNTKLNSMSVSADVLKEKLTEALTKLLGEQAKQVLSRLPLKFFKEPSTILEHRTLNALERTVMAEVTNVLREKSLRQQMTNWYLIQGLCLLSETASFKKVSASQDQGLLHKTFQKIFRLSDEEMKLYQDSFGGQRNETGLLSYIAKIRSQGKSIRAVTLENNFQGFVKGVLTPDHQAFYESRYNETIHPHLKVIFDSNPPLKDLWINNQTENFNKFIHDNGIQDRPTKVDYAKFLLNKIYNHQHLPADQYPHLKRFIDSLQNGKENEKEKESIRQYIAGELKRLKEGRKLGAKASKTELRLQIQSKLIELIELSNIDVETKASKEKDQQKKAETDALYSVLRCLDKLKEGEEFGNDLKSLVRTLCTPHKASDPVKTKDWTICFTDHYWDLFMSGTDVETCQRVDGDPALNRCLLAYLLDGKNKMLAIKDETGKIVSRCILRLLWDEEDEVPVLYLEEIYPSFLPRQQQDALIKFASFLAEDWGINLVTSESSEFSHKYPHPVSSLGGIGAEYVDALGTIVEDGQFKVHHSQFLLKARPSIKDDFKEDFPEITKRELHFSWGKTRNFRKPESVSGLSLVEDPLSSKSKLSG